MLKQKFMMAFGSRFLIYILSAGTGIIVARIAGPEIIGTVTYGVSFVSMFGFLFSFYGVTHIKMISSGEDLGKCTKVYSTIIFGTIVIYTITVILYFFIEKYTLSTQFSSTEETVIWISLIAFIVASTFKIPEITFVGLNQQAKANIPYLIQAVLYHPARIVIVLLGLGAVSLRSAELATSIILIPIYIYLLKNVPIEKKIDKELLKKYFSIGIPFILIAITNSLMQHYGKVSLKNSYSLDELGYFAGGYGLTRLMLMIGTTAGTIFFPLFSKAVANGEFDLIKTQINKYERFILLFLLPIFIVVSSYADPIIPLLIGNKYLPSVPVFSILVFTAFFSIWSNVYYNLLVGRNKYFEAASLNVLFLLIFFALLYSFLNEDQLNLGAQGLAWAMLILSIIKFGFWFVRGSRNFNIKVDKKLIIIFFANIVLFLLYTLKMNILVEDGIVFHALFILISIVCFYIFLSILKIATIDDINFLKKAFNLKSLINYTKEEIKG